MHRDLQGGWIDPGPVLAIIRDFVSFIDGVCSCDRESLDVVIVKTLTTNMSSKKQTADGDPQFAAKSNMLWGLIRGWDPALSLDDIAEDLWTERNPDFPTDSFVDLIDRMIRMCPRRRLFITEDGHLRLGPGALDVGDDVAVLLGGGTPFVICKVPEDNEQENHNRYQLVGESYVHGIMKGEIIGLWKSGQLESEDIVLV
ncbi:uncharacterized protein BDZ99DRAFT_36344 [Mytilinidion resinicola]|uniref:Heterokaryon incompatibility domain-containing protein n=1 Tax=Mytilinidion resinicola TaxID=574789 RepID=A0A6A6YP80_9PEZI|nr:uncharacterized protein BDZ99DRAFT_36344 [Mytilinidion resinicola]KAF2809785.1 hypothetical protein BDZ99DRAFT_36344 [Mytilinidion resinicola]